jgi:hypothetical protein
MSDKPKTRTPRWLRIYGLLLLLVVLLWIPIEDVTEGVAILLAAALTSWGVAYYFLLPTGTSVSRWLRYAGAGAFAGLALTPLTIILMILKTGLHLHDGPDFTPYQMARVVEWTPLWISAGLLIGLGAGLVSLVKTR